MVVSSSELETFASNVSQTQDAIFAAVGNPIDANRLRMNADLANTCEAVFEAVDSSYWLVAARDAATLDAIRKKFDAHEVPVSDLRPGAAGQ